jgi:hypothetical protein
MATVYISLIIESIIGSVRNDPINDPPVQLVTESLAFLTTEGGVLLIKE